MPSRKVTMRASMSNQITHFGVMGGLYNRKISGRSSMNRVTSRLEIPASAKEGYQYMKIHNLLSRNPLGSGGVGKMFTVRPRGSGLGSHSGKSVKNNNLESQDILKDVGETCASDVDCTSPQKCKKDDTKCPRFPSGDIIPCCVDDNLTDNPGCPGGSGCPCSSKSDCKNSESICVLGYCTP